jgi:RNA polymerase sigma-70 factor (ECF subfamily)
VPDTAATISKSGHEESTAVYATLLHDLREPVFRYLVGMTGERLTAEDLTQEVFLRAYGSLRSLRDPTAARAWLFAIAANTARSHLRRRRLERWLPLAAVDSRVEPQPLPDGALGRALRRLSAEDRDALLLIGHVGLNAGEASRVLGISLAATQKRWQRACERLRSAMEEETKP